MAFLELKDIGKIYVTEGVAAVGIRGVNLSFERGEFVAITGESGSGKSTLLNVISGMDTYEEGELYIDGEPTSHYVQSDWEKYRENYISFIFQDYNIIESYTVLQNVELALMHIDDLKERRRRALELLDRVGMTKFIKQKGSKLSGGQKQRTVIARALAKDSPIILADEPTGNLDSKTSEEIINLLHEVSKDKLLIVVTHNFEQVEHYATRHIRIFDGAVESDHVIADNLAEKNVDSNENVEKTKSKKDVQNGIVLGRSIFTSKPRLSVFMCLLMIVGTLGIFLITAICGAFGELFDENYMFSHIDGRVVVTHDNGAVLSEEDVKVLADKYGAESYLHYDLMLDYGRGYWTRISGSDEDFSIDVAYKEDYGENIIGRYATAQNEVFLYIPIYLKEYIDEEALKNADGEYQTIELYNLHYNIVGVKYFYDNNLEAKALFNDEGFELVSAMYCLLWRNLPEIEINMTVDGISQLIYANDVTASFDVEPGKLCINNSEYKKLATSDANTSVKITAFYSKYDYYYYESMYENAVTTFYTDSDISSQNVLLGYSDVVLSVDVLKNISRELFDASYRQASLFFENDAEAKAVIDDIRDDCYIAVASDSTYEGDEYETIVNTLMLVMYAGIWLLTILFLAFFINLCTSRTLGAFKGEMAIMRSMGIPVKVIKLGMYTRMLLSLIPAFVLLAVCAVAIFTVPTFNKYFIYLYWWQYFMIVAGMILLVLRVTHKQIGKLFSQSVKKSLKGGASE